MTDEPQSQPEPAPDADPLAVRVVLTAEAEVIPGPATLAARARQCGDEGDQR